MHEGKCMAEFVQNDAFLRFGRRVRCTNPTQIHGGLVGADEADFVPDVGPRARARIETDANGGVAVGNKGEVDIDILYPHGQPSRIQAHMTTYASVVPHTSGLCKDSSHHTTSAKASDICFGG